MNNELIEEISVVALEQRVEFSMFSCSGKSCDNETECDEK